MAIVDAYDDPNAESDLAVSVARASRRLIASVYTLAGNTGGAADPRPMPYQHKGSLFDVASGTNASASCSPAYLCTGEVGYDGPTGNGTPKGLGAF